MVNERIRLALRQCDVIEKGGTHHISVRLKSHNNEYSNERECAEGGEQQLLTAMAQATLDAIVPALNRPIAFKVCDLQLWNLGDPPQPFITTLVEVDFGKNQMSLPGIANISGSPFESAAKAALDSVNRIVELYLK